LLNYILREIIFRNHVSDKIDIFKELGWDISFNQIKNTVNNPDLTGKTKQNQPTAITFLNQKHILRVVYEIRNDIIEVITIHISRKGRYGT